MQTPARDGHSHLPNQDVGRDQPVRGGGTPPPYQHAHALATQRHTKGENPK